MHVHMQLPAAKHPQTIQRVPLGLTTFPPPSCSTELGGVLGQFGSFSVSFQLLCPEQPPGIRGLGCAGGELTPGAVLGDGVSPKVGRCCSSDPANTEG